MNAATKIEAVTLASAMALAFAEIDGAIKGNENAAFKQGGRVSKYADINAVIDAIKPALINHGLFFTQHPQPHDRGVQIETFLHHAGGESISLGVLFVPASKQDAQGFGSALTYARRYALVTAFGVPVEDDDGNAAAAASRKDAQAKAAPTQVQTAPAGPVTDAQWGILTDLITQTKSDSKAFCTAFKVASVKELPAAQFDRARAMLNKKLAAMVEEPA